MNQHITQLYESCRTKEALESQRQYQSANVLIGSEVEKFAELLIRECASRVDNILREKKDGGGTMGDEIREHFGVEL